MDLFFYEINLSTVLLKEILALITNVLNFNNFIPQFNSQLFDGGVSHIVAAALETKGLVDQAKILENLTVLNELAGLFYFFAVIMAVGSVAVFGSYRQGLYFLLGPSLYFFMVTQTTTTDGVKAKLGKYEIPNSVSRQSEFLDRIRAIGDEDDIKTANVSLFFAAWDGITSQVIQEITALLLKTENREHLKITAREQVFEYMLLAQPVSGVVSEIIARHHGECSAMLQEYFAAGKDAKKEVYSRRRDQADVLKEKAKADENWGIKTVIFGASDREIRGFLRAKEGSEGFPKLGVTEDDPIILTCKDLWGVIMATLKQVAKQSLDPSYFKSENEQEDDGGKAEAYEDSKKTLTEPFNGASAEDVLTVHQYRNYLNKSSHSALNTQIFSNSPFNAKEYHLAFQELPGAEARGAFFGLRYFATSLPYLQGLLLYLLCIAFPFFAVLLVIPGKAPSFLIWCSLWVWVKSWDIGFAIVLVVKDLYWEMLKHSQNTFDNKIDLSDPFSVFSVALNSDPLANLRTYWEISYALTIGIPFLTAHFCLGATDMFEMFKSGVSETVGRFKQVETAAGKRSIGNQIEASRAEEQKRVSMTFAGQTSGERPKGLGEQGRGLGTGGYSPLGAQTSHGHPIAYDDSKRGPSLINMTHRIANARQTQAMVGYKIADSLTQMGNRDVTNALSQQTDRVYAIEASSVAAIGGNGNAQHYKMPESFKDISDLDKNVTPEMIQQANKSYEEKVTNREAPAGLSFDPKKTYTYEEFMLLQAQQNGEKVVIPHVMRGLTSLDSTVSKEDLEYMFPDAQNALRRAAEKGEAVRWSDVFNETHENQRTHHAYLAATVGRRSFSPDTTGASMSFLQGIRFGEAVANTGRAAIEGKQGMTPQNAVPGMEFIYLQYRGDLVDETHEAPGQPGGIEGATGPDKSSVKSSGK